MNPAPAGAGASATLRPRNRRLISLEGDESLARSRSLSPVASVREETTASASGSRAASPLPAPHPSRATASAPRSAPDRTTTGTRSLRAPSWPSRKPIFAASYWETSWSSIQGVASTLLGNNLPEPQQRRRLGHGYKYSFGASFDEWGPVGGAERHIAVGSQEDRLARLQAKRREALLLGNGHADAAVDGLGRFKRRMSTDYGAAAAEEEEAAAADLPVYLHHVRPADTLAGLSIRYNCTQATIRKANRLYPNDTIQVRQRAYVPVDACGIKGRKVDSPQPEPPPPPSADLLGGDAAPEDSSSTPRPGADWTIGSPTTPRAFSFSSRQPLASPTLSTATSRTEPPHTHDSWVAIDHIAEPVEIVRMPRRALGFFPPARRRSVSYTDSSPAPGSPVLSGLPPGLGSASHSPGRSRTRNSPSLNSGRAAHDYFTQHPRAFSGPGGVGSLSRTASPGPPMDGLNRWVNTALPAAVERAAAAAGVQLPPRLGPPASFNGNAPGRAGSLGPGGGLSVARSSFDSVASAGSELAGRVEGWVRKTGGPPGRSPRAGGAEPDLIEMVEGAEGGSADGRSRAGSASAMEIEEERLLRERFPVRGRVFEEQPRGRK